MTRAPAEKPGLPAGRIVAYDALRIFAILTVVLIHTLMPYRDVLPENAPVRVFDDVLHYAVPLFVFISGALLWSRSWWPESGMYRRFVTRRIGLIGKPYLAWAALFSAIYVVRAADTREAVIRLPGLAATGHVWYHLYFVPMLLTFYLLTPVASRIAKWSPELLLAIAYTLRIVAGPPLTHAAAELSPLFGQYTTHVLSHLPHMALGAWLALRLERMPGWVRAAWPLLLTGGLAGLAWGSVNALPAWPFELERLLFPGAMAATVLGMALGAIRLEPLYARRSTSITRLGSLAFGVYFMHPLLLLTVDGLIAVSGAEWPWGHWWFTVVVWAGVSAACFALSSVLGRDRPTAWLVGLRVDSPHPRRT
jgi:surface polysaccharide O-acyltransferase-like enzyme